MTDARPASGPTPLPVVDWALAERTGVRLAPRGPAVALTVAREAVAELAAHARDATGHVADVTGLVVPQASSPVRVVERSAWVRANVAGLRELIDPVLGSAVQVRLERAAAKRSAKAGTLSGRLGRLDRIGSDPRLALAAGAKVTGTEVGALLGWMSSRVLGQYDAFGPGGGQLLLVAPNVVAVEREMGVDPRDFRLWVALHEETHRVQFAAAPWLAGHLASRARALSGDLVGADGESGPTERLLALVRSVARPGGLASLRGGDGADGAEGGGPLSAGLVSALAGPAQRRTLAEVTAVMSLLEGHADVVMDEAGPGVIPSVASIRARFSDRRASGRSAVDRAVRTLLGMDAKMRQYTDGARFVRAVVAEVGHEGLNQVWSGPQALPLPEEIARPRLWLDRVHA